MVADSDVVCPCPVPTSFRWSQPFLGTESLQYQWKRETTDRALMARVGAVMADQSIAPETDINDERSVRRAKRQALIDAGVNPYPTKSDITAHAAELAERYASLEGGADTTDEYSLAGRIRAYRRQGKARFLVIEDVSGEIQLFCRVNNLSAEDWGLLGQLDLGDIIQARGTVLRTRRGQLSVSPTSVTLLSKSVRPLPEKFHGLTDRELRYRQRYVDLIMNRDVRDTFRMRSAIVSQIRRYMESDGYIEVETPMMHAILGGANARPFVTHFNALDRNFYLRIATELPLKRLIVGGMERVFEIGRQFRNEGMDLTHNPEFTSMEAYCAYSDLQGMKDLTMGLFKAIAREACGCEEGHEAIVYQGQEIDLSGTWRSATVAEIASEVCGEELTIDTPLDHLRELCAAHSIEWQENWGAGKLLFELYDELGEETLVNPTFVCDYPEEVSPLAKRKDDDPRITDRFELVIAGHEYANAFSELNDPVDQAGRFAEQVAAKGFGDDEAMGYDYDYVRALEYGMPPAGGIGFGIDRMVMLFCDQPAIRDVLLFPQMKPETVTREQIAAQVTGVRTDGAAANVDALLSAAGTGVGPGAVRADDDGGVAATAGPTDVGPELPVVSVPGPAGSVVEGDVTIEPIAADVSFDDFSRSDMRVVRVRECVAVPKSKKLLRFTLDDGTGEERTILSGIHAYYEPEDLVGKNLVAITNIPPRRMMGVDSCGMLLSAIHEVKGEERLDLLMVDDAIPAGSKLY